MNISTKKPNRKHNVIRLVVILTVIYALNGYFLLGIINKKIDAIETDNSSIEKSNQEIAKYRLIARKWLPVYINLPKADQIRAIVDNYENPASIWRLINKENSIPTDYIPANISIPNVATRTDNSTDGRLVRNDIAADLKAMFDAASTYSYQLVIASGYRSAATQSSIYNNAVAVDGYGTANKFVAVPGHSEHQSGLAVDITTASRACYIDSCFADTSDGQWLAQNSYKYGFILRYPKGKENITGYNYEPWHFRYVGKDLATALYQSNLTLEEAYPYIQTALVTLKKNGAL